MDTVSEDVLREIYAQVGCDYDAVLARMLTAERVAKFLKIFANEGSFDTLETALAEGNRSEAFRASHTLKGTAREMGFTTLGDAASDVCETLRPETGEGLEAAEALMPKARELYASVIEAISVL